MMQFLVLVRAIFAILASSQALKLERHEGSKDWWPLKKGLKTEDVVRETNS